MRAGATLVASAVLALAAPCVAHAAMPGANGKIAFARWNTDRLDSSVDVINPDGTGRTTIVNNYATELAWSADGTRLLYSDGGLTYTVAPDGSDRRYVTLTNTGSDFSWSPDDTRIAYHDEVCHAEDGCEEMIFTMNPDGSNYVKIADDAFYPTWSPDGSKIAFLSRLTDPPYYQVFTMGPDGSARTPLPVSIRAQWLDWSPNGQKLAFAYWDGDYEIYVVNADGSGLTRLTNNPAADFRPAWSPDGTKIAFTSNRNDPNPSCGIPERSCVNHIYVMNADGTDQTDLTPDDSHADFAAWQSQPGNYIRPKAAAPIRVSLAPAYRQCNPALANRTHGPPLAFPACNPPSRASSHLTVGTPDANGASAKASAFVRYGVRIGNPKTPADEADVRIIASLTDVRNDLTLVDYAGELQLDQTLRITDRDNSPTAGTPGPGTVIDTNFPVTIPCVPTADTTVGSTCAIDTTVEAIVPNAVKEGRRAVWEVGQVKVYDGGSDGVAGTLGDNTLFMDQGLFVP